VTQSVVSESYDIAIVGGGMVGTALACALAETSFRVVLVEAGAPQALPEMTAETPFEPRVSALTEASRNLLNNIGAWPLMADTRISPYREMYVWDAEGTGEIHFKARDVGQPVLGHIVENAVVVSGLFARLAELQASHPEQLTLKTGLQLAQLEAAGDDCHTLTLSDDSQLTARLVIGADGAHSNVRQQAGLELREWDYGHEAIVTTVRTSQSNQATAWQHFLPSGPLAFLPLCEQGTAPGASQLSSIVWSLDSDKVEEVMALPEAEFNQALTRAFEGRLGEVEWSDQRFSFPLRQRHAKQYIKPGIALMGDAAHTIHPLAGQGVNLGFLDVAVMAEELSRADRRGLNPGELSVLRRFQRRRQGDNLLMAGTMEGFKRLFGETAPAIRWLRSTGMSLVNQLGPVKDKVISRAMGLEGDLPELAKPRFHL